MEISASNETACGEEVNDPAYPYLDGTYRLDFDFVPAAVSLLETVIFLFEEEVLDYLSVVDFGHETVVEVRVNGENGGVGVQTGGRILRLLFG